MASFAADPRSPRVHDVIGLGLGPANLALAIALEEAPDEWGEPRLDHLFLERKPGWSWHPGMLLDGAGVQVSFLKDLATMVDPTSRFTFLNYLKEQDRLHEFINLRDFFPSRVEFNSYFAWAADQLADRMRYGREVVAVEPAGRVNGTIDELEVVARRCDGGGEERYRTRNLVIATGGQPCLPEGIELPASGRACHSHEFLQFLRERFPDRDRPYRLLVVGAGQSGAEILDYLIRHYPAARITAVLRRFAFKPLDDSAFVNELFFPSMIDFLYDRSEETRRAILAMHPDTNTSAVDFSLIRRIYRAIYEERVAGRDRVEVRPFIELEKLYDQGSDVVAEIYDRVRRTKGRIAADGVVLATGYSRDPRHPLLAGLAPYLIETRPGRYEVRRDYSLVGSPELRPGIFLQGFCEETHGITDPLLSLMPVRAREITRVLLDRRGAQGAVAAPEALDAAFSSLTQVD